MRRAILQGRQWVVEGSFLLYPFTSANICACLRESAPHTFHAPNISKWEITAAFAAPASPLLCSPWDTPPGTAASLRPRSRCADRLRPATRDERSAAPATTSD